MGSGPTIKAVAGQEDERFAGGTIWEQVAADADFQRLLAEKARFILAGTLTFLIYYFALPVLVGYAPEFMKTPVLGRLNLAYLFALSQFAMTWILAWVYVRRAARFDQQASHVLAKFDLKERA